MELYEIIDLTMLLKCFNITKLTHRQWKRLSSEFMQ